MRILFLNRSDSEGGAARGVNLLLDGIAPQQKDVRLYVQKKKSRNPRVISASPLLGKILGPARRMLESVIFGLPFRKTQGLFSPAFIPDRLASQVSDFNPDIIHLHWVARMMRLENISRFKPPVVWTLHDSWPFTGGCFLPGDCDRYQGMCGSCPVLGSSREDDLSRWIWSRKMKAWQDLDLTLIAPSSWMFERARASSLFREKRVEHIPNGLDVQLFKPADKQGARKHFSLPYDKKLILFGAKSALRDSNKGFHLLLQALRQIRGSLHDEIELVVFGDSQTSQLLDIGMKTHLMGWQSEDNNLALLYAAADIFVLPSLQENLPYAVMEAMACSIPCVAFHQGGIPDLIDHKQNGYLAKQYDTDDLAQGITRMLQNDEYRKMMGIKARQKIMQKFSIGRVVERHMNLFQELIVRKQPAVNFLSL